MNTHCGAMIRSYNRYRSRTLHRWGWARERCTALCADVTRPSRPQSDPAPDHRKDSRRFDEYGGCTEHKVARRGEMIYHFPFTAGLGWLMYRMGYREKIGEVPDWVTLEHPQHRACI